MSALQAAAPVVGAIVAVVLLAGCESSQSKSARLAAQGGAAADRIGLRVERQTSKVEVLSTHVVSDENGTATVVGLRNATRGTLRDVPVAIDVTDRAGRSVFRNDDPGLEPSLLGPSLLGPGERFLWVNDQVLAAGDARRAEARVGEPDRAPRSVPRVVLSRPRLRDDPVSGVAAVGRVTNRSRVEQRRLVIYGVARRGRRIVAAGRAQIERLKAGARKSFQVFFIGDPRGARISLEAPPTTFR